MGISSPAGSIWFQGDWSDPWVEGIADALPRVQELRRLDPTSVWQVESGPPPDLLILHKNRLLPKDAELFARWKAESAWPRFPATILCYGPFARYAELDRWLSLADVVIPEATAPDTLPRRVERCLNLGPAPDAIDVGSVSAESAQVVVASTNPDLRRTLADLCAEWVPRVVAQADYRFEYAGRAEARASLRVGATITVIDVPLLESGWEAGIERAAHWGPVIALFGFPSRSNVETARRLGAWACLDLPFDREDLAYTLRRCLRGVEAGRAAGLAGFEPGHQLPRPPVSFRVSNPKRPMTHRDP